MILDTIAAAARLRVARAKQICSVSSLRSQAFALPKGDFAFEKALASPGLSFICEVKKASPSKGIIAPYFPYVDIAKEYEAAGASAVSVLTEPEFFLGSDQYLAEIKDAVSLPLLRKDFTVDEYQIYEAKVLGASAVLLICALLDQTALETFLRLCDQLGLSALVEAHTDEEVLAAVNAGARVIGVNNRNLKTFEVDFDHAVRLRSMVPPSVIFVAESGVKGPQDIGRLSAAGVQAVLIGETLMRAADRKAMLASFKEAAALPSGRRPQAKIKICGLSREEDIKTANHCLPDYIGFVFAKSKRSVTPETAARLKALLDPEIKAVGVFVNASADQIVSIARAKTIDLIQLHGEEDSRYLEALTSSLKDAGLDVPIIKAVRVRSREDILNACRLPCRYLLLDTYEEDSYGGTGRQFDWSLIPALHKPYFLAGGLSLDNIKEAAATGAFCLDLSSAVETDGHKDAGKIEEIISLVRGGL